eukprot:SAG25_NODE_1510_length_2868_cov_1.974359_1_plen_151_part_00
MVYEPVPVSFSKEYRMSAEYRGSYTLPSLSYMMLPCRNGLGCRTLAAPLLLRAAFVLLAVTAESLWPAALNPVGKVPAMVDEALDLTMFGGSIISATTLFPPLHHSTTPPLHHSTTPPPAYLRVEEALTYRHRTTPAWLLRVWGNGAMVV